MIALVKRQSATVQLAFAIACLVSVALAHVYVRLQLIQTGYELGRESRAHHELSEQNQKLRIELATRKDPMVTERRAREELHMAPPDPRAIRIVRMGRSDALERR